MPSGLATLTSMVPPPAGPGGTWASIDVGEVTVKVAGTDPNWTEVAPTKSEPETVTVPPPDVGPLSGSTARTCGDTKVYSPIDTAALVPAPAPAVVTVTGS